MKNDVFNEFAFQHFRYLIDDFSFRVTRDIRIDSRIALEGGVKYMSPTTFVWLSGHIDGVDVIFGRAADSRKFGLSVELLHEFLSLTPGQRHIVCSKDRDDRFDADLLILRNKLRHEENKLHTKAEREEQQFVDHAFWLRECADPFLRGDFSMWIELQEYKLARAIGALRRSDQSEIVTQRTIPSDGKPKYGTWHRFQKDIDYLDRLRSKALLAG